MSGETLAQRRRRIGGTYVIDAMKEDNIDISDNHCVQVTEEMLQKYDKIINMADTVQTPEWLRQHPGYEFWDVKDPGGKDLEATNIAKAVIKQKIENLLAESP